MSNGERILDPSRSSGAARTKYIIASSLLACLLLYFLERVLVVDYLLKTAAKILLFTVIPWLYRSGLGRKASPETNGMATGRRTLWAGLLLGVAAFVIVLATYRVVGGALDLPAIALQLQDQAKITPANFLLVGLYITFGNSFLEEFFFRGFVFLSLKEAGDRNAAYFYSSVLFGLYHISIFQSWFNPWLIGLALFGLVTVGLILDWLDEAAGHFRNSWLTHILADAAIILIGLRMFALI